KDVIREKTDVGVVILDGLVIAAALDGDAVFGSGQLVLKGQEVLIGFEIGIVLDDGQQPAQGAIQLAIRSDPVCRRSGAQQGGAGIIDVSEHFHLLRRITFHGCHEIRNQVGAPLQHHIYLRPCLFDSLIFADHLVSAADVRQSNNKGNQRQYSHHNQQCLHDIPPRNSAGVARTCFVGPQLFLAPLGTSRGPTEQVRATLRFYPFAGGAASRRSISSVTSATLSRYASNVAWTSTSRLCLRPSRMSKMV